MHIAAFLGIFPLNLGPRNLNQRDFSCFMQIHIFKCIFHFKIQICAFIPLKTPELNGFTGYTETSHLFFSKRQEKDCIKNAKNNKTSIFWEKDREIRSGHPSSGQEDPWCSRTSTFQKEISNRLPLERSGHLSHRSRLAGFGTGWENLSDFKS